MTTLELQLDDELNAFVLRQARERGHPSAAAYVESLLAIERLRDRGEQVDILLQNSRRDDSGSRLVDDSYWRKLFEEVLGADSAEVNQ